MSDNYFIDLATEKMQQALLHMRAQEEAVYKQAIEKHFGEYSEEHAQKCTIVPVGKVKRLMYGDIPLCEIYPLEQNSFLGSTATTQVSLNQNYRIF